MLLVILSCGLLVTLTTGLHYEVLRGLNFGLPLLSIPNRTKLFVVIIAAFFAHATEMALYGLALHVLDGHLGGGVLSGATSLSLGTAMFLSAETYTSLGFGDFTPAGPLRLLAGSGRELSTEQWPGYHRRTHRSRSRRGHH